MLLIIKEVKSGNYSKMFQLKPSRMITHKEQESALSLSCRN